MQKKKTLMGVAWTMLWHRSSVRVGMGSFLMSTCASPQLLEDKVCTSHATMQRGDVETAAGPWSVNGGFNRNDIMCQEHFSWLSDRLLGAIFGSGSGRRPRVIPLCNEQLPSPAYQSQYLIACGGGTVS